MSITNALLSEFDQEMAGTRKVLSRCPNVYLRMNDIPVPALYGPSADEAN
jgi:hypothetical protein